MSICPSMCLSMRCISGHMDENLTLETLKEM